MTAPPSSCCIGWRVSTCSATGSGAWQGELGDTSCMTDPNPPAGFLDDVAVALARARGPAIAACDQPLRAGDTGSGSQVAQPPRDRSISPSVVDIAGLNQVTRRILANAAAAMAGMVTGVTEQPNMLAPARGREHVRCDDPVRHPRT